MCTSPFFGTSPSSSSSYLWITRVGAFQTLGVETVGGAVGGQRRGREERVEVIDGRFWLDDGDVRFGRWKVINGRMEESGATISNGPRLSTSNSALLSHPRTLPPATPWTKLSCSCLRSDSASRSVRWKGRSVRVGHDFILLFLFYYLIFLYAFGIAQIWIEFSDGKSVQLNGLKSKNKKSESICLSVCLCVGVYMSACLFCLVICHVCLHNVNNSL